MQPRSEMVPYTLSAAALAPPQSPFTGAGLSFSQILAIARAYWKKAAMIVAGFVAAAALITVVMPKTYMATATLMVNYEINDPLAGREFPVALLGNYMATQVELLSSPAVLRDVVTRLKLTERKHYAAGFKGDPAALTDWVVKQVTKKLVVLQGQYGSQLIHVTFSAPTAADSAAIANMIVDVYREQLHARQTGPAAEQAGRYGEELENLKAKVNKAQEQVTAFRTENQLVEIQARADIESASLNELEQRLLEAQNARRAAEAKLSADQSVTATVLNSQLVQNLKTRIATLEAQQAELSNSLGSKHPQMIDVNAQLRAARKSLAEEIARYGTSASDELVSARELEQKLVAAVQEQKTKTLKVRKQQEEGAKYVLELESAQSSYKKALDGYDSVLIASHGRYTNVSVVNRATPPLRASKPNPVLNLALGLIAGLGAGIFFPLCYELLLKRRVRSRDDLERDFGIPVLAEFEPVPALRQYA